MEGQREKQVSAFQHTYRLPSVVAGLADERGLVWSVACGAANPATTTPASAETIYRIGSITKTFTATAILQLRDAGRLRLDDPLVVHLPGFAKATNPYGPIEEVTIRRLLSHQGGVPVESPVFDWATRHFPSPEELVATLDRMSLVLEPATEVKYSNFGYELLGEVIARVGGRPYREHIRDRILLPLGMKDTTFDPADAGERMAQGHDPPAFSDSPAPAPDRMKSTDADGGLCSSVGDLAQWIALQLRAQRGTEASGAQILSGASLAEMHRPRRLLDAGWTQAIGLGWRVFRRGDELRIGHAGGTFGFTTKVTFSRERALGAIVLCNGEGPVAELADALLELEDGDGERSGTAIPAIPVPVPESIRPLLGLYAWEDHSAPAALEWVDGHLVLTWLGTGPRGDHDPRTLIPTENPTRFTVSGGRDTGETCVFDLNPSGDVTGLTISGWPLVRLISAR